MTRQLLITIASLLITASPVFASDADEFKIKRQEIFEFTEKPSVTRDGDRVAIAFAVKSYCDVTIVIEDAQGKIVRHLVSGVLGDKAPPPLRVKTLQQKVIWDGKDDKGAYVDNKDSCHVRVSLGLKASYDKDLFSEPKKRMHQEASGMAATLEGVYVYDGRVLDHLRLFDHEGNYRKTIYPFPADQVRNVKGLHWFKMPQDGLELPLREGFHQATLLSSGINGGFDPKLGLGADQHNNYHGSVWGNAASTLAVNGKRIALARLSLNRLATDGSSGGLDLNGPTTSVGIPAGLRKNAIAHIAPYRSAFSPDGKTLYLTGYVSPLNQAATKDIVLITGYDWVPVVAKIDFAEGKTLETFAGSMKPAEAGSGEKQFKTPSSVAVDAAGRVYVSDFSNDRVQVYSPAGELLKSIASSSPAQVSIHQKTQEIYIFSWTIPTNTPVKKYADGLPPKLTILKSFADPTVVQTMAVPVSPNMDRSSGMPLRAEVDGFAEPTTIWFCAEWGRLDILSRDRIKHGNISIYTLENGQLKQKRDFNEDAVKSVVRTEAAEYSRQRLNVDPVTGLLYLNEGQAASGKSSKDVIRIDPETGKCEQVTLPFDAEDMCFDAEGNIYLRTFYQVARYNPRTWQEVPFDYGEEVNDIRTSSSREAKPAKAQSALRLPVKHAGLHHHGGMSVSIRGNLIVAVNNTANATTDRKDIYDAPVEPTGKPYTPPAFPGRVAWGEVHVWDKQGQMLYEDAIPGLLKLDGMGMDCDGNLYVMSTLTRVLDGERYFNFMTGSMIKVRAKKVKVLGVIDRAIVPLTKDSQPDRKPEVQNNQLGSGWVEGAEWFYGGVGFSGKNGGPGGGCDCYNARFAFDYLSRSFAPEIDHCSVAVLDSAGNLILRIGQYGNLDSAGPKSAVPLKGDGVGLFYAPYVATQTDKKLYIADPGNGRVVSVNLSYHASEKVALK